MHGLPQHQCLVNLTMSRNWKRSEALGSTANKYSQEGLTLVKLLCTLLLHAIHVLVG